MATQVLRALDSYRGHCDQTSNVAMFCHHVNKQLTSPRSKASLVEFLMLKWDMPFNPSLSFTWLLFRAHNGGDNGLRSSNQGVGATREAEGKFENSRSHAAPEIFRLMITALFVSRFPHWHELPTTLDIDPFLVVLAAASNTGFDVSLICRHVITSLFQTLLRTCVPRFFVLDPCFCL